MNRDSARRRSPGTWQVFQQDLSSARRRFQSALDPLVNWLFEFTQRGSKRRSTLFVALSALLWITLALLSNPPVPSHVPLLEQLFRAVTSFEVVRHFLVLWLAMFLATRLAAFYLEDIYELSDFQTAERFIRSATFSGNYPVVRISEGGLNPDDQNNPVFAIGGPGRVVAALENAALFERIDGSPHVISSTDRRFGTLDGFERLRSIIDLRNQSVELEVTGPTRDGILVTAKDVRAEYSIDRGEQETPLRANFQQPYPFSEQAVQKLAYREGKERLPDRSSMASYIQGQLLKFIASHTLSEFISNADSDNLDGNITPQDELKERFYQQAREIEDRGLKLNWIGIGTWVLPNDLIPKHHIQAWKISSENRIRRSRTARDKLYHASRLSELFHLIDELQLQFLRMQDAHTDPATIIRNLLHNLWVKLRAARQSLEDQGQPVPPELDAGIKYLTSLLQYRLDQE